MVWFYNYNLHRLCCDKSVEHLSGFDDMEKYLQQSNPWYFFGHASISRDLDIDVDVSIETELQLESCSSSSCNINNTSTNRESIK